VIDSHTHLDACAPPDEELVAAAVQAGVTRMVTIGTDGASCRRALQAAEAAGLDPGPATHAEAAEPSD